MFASPLLLGLLLGVRHAADADHVATIATVVLGRNLLGALRTALLWGAGHSLTFFAVGLGIVLFGLHVPATFELLVDVAIALSLLVLGGIQLARLRKDQLASGEASASRPLLLGSLHGLAGSAAIALLALTTIHTKHEALLYLVLFALGTIAGMAVITLCLALSFRMSASSSRVQKGLVVSAGVLSCVCGLSILAELWSEGDAAAESARAHKRLDVCAALPPTPMSPSRSASRLRNSSRDCSAVRPASHQASGDRGNARAHERKVPDSCLVAQCS